LGRDARIRQGRQRRLHFPKCREVQGQIPDAWFQRQGETRRWRYVAERIRPHEVDRNGRGKDHSACEKSRALRRIRRAKDPLRVFALMKVVVLNHMSLDGVIQSPARQDEDTRNGFSHGGWAVAGGDPVMTEWIGPISSGGAGGMLLGRRSYEGMLSHWNRAGGPFKDALNAAPKYVASRSASTRLEWPNSTLLHGDIPAAVAELNHQAEGQLL